MFKKLTLTVPFKRLRIYLLILGSLPLIATFFYVHQEKKKWNLVEERMSQVHHLATTLASKQYTNTVVRKWHLDAEPLYLEHQLESLLFLKKETEAHQWLLNSPTFTGNEAAEKRYAYLTSKANRCDFVPERIQVADHIQETEFFLSHPIEVDAQDIKELLVRIEGNRKGKPQLLITDFTLSKNKLASSNEVFRLNMKLLKRDFQ